MTECEPGSCALCGDPDDLVLDVPVITADGPAVRRLCAACLAVVLAAVTHEARKLRGQP